MIYLKTEPHKKYNCGYKLPVIAQLLIFRYVMGKPPPVGHTRPVKALLSGSLNLHRYISIIMLIQFSYFLQCQHILNTRHGRPQKFFQGGQSRHFAYPFQFVWWCNANRLTQNASPFLHHKENAQCYGNSCI